MKALLCSLSCTLLLVNSCAKMEDYENTPQRARLMAHQWQITEAYRDGQPALPECRKDDIWEFTGSGHLLEHLHQPCDSSGETLRRYDYILLDQEQYLQLNDAGGQRHYFRLLPEGNTGFRLQEIAGADSVRDDFFISATMH